MGRVKEADLGPEADENWKSKDPKALAHEIATFMGGQWPTRPVRKVQLAMDGVPTVRRSPGRAEPLGGRGSGAGQRQLIAAAHASRLPHRTAREPRRPRGNRGGEDAEEWSADLARLRPG